mmetsp:Transcript_57623/g.129940  ORF Transcript_57623/g.129940 Transcript_57623/m.129940 type:complete len:221 (-) Transcript_57623:225-887(-)
MKITMVATSSSMSFALSVVAFFLSFICEFMLTNFCWCSESIESNSFACTDWAYSSNQAFQTVWRRPVSLPPVTLSMTALDRWLLSVWNFFILSSCALTSVMYLAFFLVSWVLRAHAWKDIVLRDSSAPAQRRAIVFCALSFCTAFKLSILVFADSIWSFSSLLSLESSVSLAHTLKHSSFRALPLDSAFLERTPRTLLTFFCLYIMSLSVASSIIFWNFL